MLGTPSFKGQEQPGPNLTGETPETCPKKERGAVKVGRRSGKAVGEELVANLGVRDPTSREPDEPLYIP